MRVMIYLIFMALLLVGCSEKQLQASASRSIEGNVEQKEIKQPFDINKIQINYERAFVHDINAVTILAKIKNESGYDIKVSEVLDLNTTGADGFQLSHQNSYSMNGEVLGNGEKDRMTLLYFKSGSDAKNLLTVQPSFNIEVDGETYLINGEVLNVE